MQALVLNKTVPPISVRVESFEIAGQMVGRISVDKSQQLVSTTEGLLQYRCLNTNGKPEAVPFYPHQFGQRLSSFGAVDFSSQVLRDISVELLNPLEHHRIREAIRKYTGDSSLLPLSDSELDAALGLTTEEYGVFHPTVSGLLLLGSEEHLRQYLPAHEVAFQVLEGTNVRVNEFFRKPLLQTFEDIEQLFRARFSEKEVQYGLFRVSIPNYDRRAFREAFVNALVHRDYSRLGAVHIKFDDDGLTISSPGGFVEGVTIQNILVAAPRSRNPRLADIVKRIGLAERTGRGVDRIFEGMLRFGRSEPDYSLSDSSIVAVNLANSDPDLNFLGMILQQEDLSQSPVPLNTLIILSRLRDERRLGISDLVAALQKPESAVRSMIEKLVELGLVEAHGSRRSRTYTLSHAVYQQAGQKAAYVRQVGFDNIQQEQMVLQYVNRHGSIQRADVMELCRISKDQAYRLLLRLRTDGKIEAIGEGKAASYVLKE